MGEINKVTVKIYGQEYTIAGEMSEDKIIQAANYANVKMQEIASSMPLAQAGNIAVWSAVNVSVEYFDLKDKLEKMTAENDKLKSDVEKIERRWDESKEAIIRANSAAVTAAEAEAEEAEHEDIVLTVSEKAEELHDRRSYEELEERCSELEKGYYDLQMENIRLKSELDRLR